MRGRSRQKGSRGGGEILLQRPRGKAEGGGGATARCVARGVRELLAGGRGDGGATSAGAPSGRGLEAGRGPGARPAGTGGRAAGLHGQEGPPAGPRRPDLLSRR